MRDNIVMRNYTTSVDKNNKTYLNITEYAYTPYSMKGKDIVEQTKGKNIDVKV